MEIKEYRVSRVMLVNLTALRLTSLTEARILVKYHLARQPRNLKLLKAKRCLTFPDGCSYSKVAQKKKKAGDVLLQIHVPTWKSILDWTKSIHTIMLPQPKFLDTSSTSQVRTNNALM